MKTARLVVVLGLCTLTVGVMPALTTAKEAAVSTPRRIILMIGDGMGFGQVSAYRQYADNPATPALESTVFDDLLIGTIATRPSGDSDLITDSAAGATAYACGVKSFNGAIGVDADNKPCETVLERAGQRGKSTGVVVTSQLTHATPAAFYAHVSSRKNIAEIAEQFFTGTGARKVDVAFGGGADDFSASQRQQLQQSGVQLVTTPAQLAALKQPPTFGTFAAAGLPMAIDRDANTPSLASMTDKALALLDANPRGFFLMVEGSQIDWASHGNDIVGVLSEMQDFATAIASARRYADQHPDTLLVITADHETGGLSLGRDKQWQWRATLLHQIRASAAGMAARVLAGEDAVATLQALSPIIADDADRARLNASERDADRLEEAFADIIAKHSLTGWTTRGHTGADVPLYAFGPGSASLRGHHDNHWLGQRLMEFVQAGGPAPSAANRSMTDRSKTGRSQTDHSTTAKP
ncbi:alkaline phosphatase [Permianibacter sp. IMCC34836]|uniref:alkaline phosphatase n=1 Tax=Permianibacter fluminis TaxID=2738515 RepID=UPI00155625F2|nr:alkaline phosphatase [Permianibacter fluminis]NQD36275.1 alkaline phosphatase [Permianibacter fluminis]